MMSRLRPQDEEVWNLRTPEDIRVVRVSRLIHVRVETIAGLGSIGVCTLYTVRSRLNAYSN